MVISKTFLQSKTSNCDWLKYLTSTSSSLSSSLSSSILSSLSLSLGFFINSNLILGSVYLSTILINSVGNVVLINLDLNLLELYSF
jgi:hypothetical protein